MQKQLPPARRRPAARLGAVRVFFCFIFLGFLYSWGTRVPNIVCRGTIITYSGVVMVASRLPQRNGTPEDSRFTTASPVSACGHLCL